MKSWRTITAAAVVALGATSSVFALGTCAPDLQLKEVCGLTICAERQNTTSTGVGNLYPWVNSGFFFATYRNQYLYPSSTIATVGTIASTIESVHSRSTSFTGTSVNNYTAASFVKVSQPPSSTLLRTFSLNTAGPENLHVPRAGIPGAFRVQHIPGTAIGGSNANPATLSDFNSEPGDAKARNRLTTVVNTSTAPNLMLDQLNFLGGGNSGFGVWDLTSGACTGPARAYGSSTFFNVNNLTTAYGVDNMAFVWVFCGLALPPPATVQQQISEIIRLLLTPESLRCSSLDLTNDGKLSDDPFQYPQGKDYDTTSPRVTSGGTITGEEGGAASKRTTGWQ